MQMNDRSAQQHQMNDKPASDGKPDGFLSRHMVREKAMQVLYALEISGGSVLELFDSIAREELEIDERQCAFARSLVYTTINHQTETDAYIQTHILHWNMGRVAPLDLVLLRLGVTEFLFFPEIPSKVTINECVDIAKRFSTENSGKFVNGLLDAILKSLLAEGKIIKVGRGLVES